MADRAYQPQQPRRSAATGRINSLGLSKRELDQLLDEIDGAAPGKGATGGEAGGAPGRRYARRNFRQARLPMQVSQAGGHIATFPVACRNISRTGMSVLHSAYIHTGTRCTLVLPGARGETHTVTGAVVRCQHRRGMIHEIGVLFDHPVNLREVLALDCIGDWFSLERVDPAELTGKVLYVEDCAVDRQLVRHHLKDTTLSVTTAEDPVAGLAKAATGFDIILCAFHMPVMDGPAFIEQIRARGIATPVLVLAHDADEPTRRKLARLANIALLTKPVPRELLLRAIAEFLIVSPSRHSGADEREMVLSGEPMRELVADFLRDLPRLGENLTEVRGSDDAEACRQVCMKIRGSARSLGLSDLAHIADLATAKLATGASVADAAADLDRLLAACSQPGTRQAS